MVKIALTGSTCIPFFVFASFRQTVRRANAMKIKMMTPVDVITAGTVMSFGSLGSWVVALVSIQAKDI